MSPRPGSPSWIARGAPCGLYVVCAVLVSYPLVRELGKVLPGVAGDCAGFLWSMDTFWTHVAAGESPWYTRRILFPVGANMAYSVSLPLFALGAWPFLDHLMLYADLLTFASLVAAAFGMMLLVRALVADDGAAAIAGLLYGFSPTLLSFLYAGQVPQLAAAAMIPYGVLAVIRFMRGARTAALVAASAAAWAVAVTQVYTTAAFLVIVLIVGAVLVRRCLTVAHVRRAAVALAANLVLAWTVVHWVLPAVDPGEYTGSGYGFTSTGVVNLANLVIPSASNPLLGSLEVRAFDRNNGDVRSYFLGWSILALAIGTAIALRRDPEIRALGLAGLAVLLLACGSAIHLGSRVLADHDRTPFEWLARLPYFGLLDTPRRLVVGTAFAVAALAGCGLARLARASGHPRVVYVAALAVVALEYGQVGNPITVVPVPGVYRELAAEPDSRTVMELSGGLAASWGGLGITWATPSSFLMYWQTIHRKPRVGGYVSRLSESTYRWFEHQPIMGDLLRMSHSGGPPWPDPNVTPAGVGSFVETFNLGYVIIPPSDRQREYAGVIEMLLAGRIARTVSDDDGYVLYVLAPGQSGAAHSTAGSMARAS
jgi:hypothetical protein